MIILTLFGTTTGLELLNIPLVNNIPPLKLEDAWIGVNSSQLTLQSDKDSYLIFRRSVSGHLVTWIGLYRPIREMGYDRAGSFYGAGVWIIDGVVDAKNLIVLLREMIDQVNSTAVQGDRFIKKLVDVKGQFTPPNQVSSLISSYSKVNAGFKSEGESGFIIDTTVPLDVIEWAQRGSSASYFSKIVIGTADNVPGAGQSSTFKIFPSLSMAIETAYLRHISEARNRTQELTQTMISLENKNIEKERELQSTAAKLNQTEISRQQFRDAAIKYENLYKEIFNVRPAPRNSSSSTNSYSLVEDNDVITGYGDLFKTKSDLPNTNQSFPHNNFNNIPSKSQEFQRPPKYNNSNNTTPQSQENSNQPKSKIYVDDGITITQFIFGVIIALVIILVVWGLLYPKKDCVFHNIGCSSNTKSSPTNSQPFSPNDPSGPGQSNLGQKINP